MAWKFESGVALTLQIADRLRVDILGGAYDSGSPFPTVRQLAETAGVNPNTMQKALGLLENEGLLITQSTAGRIVTDDDEVLASVRDRYLTAFADRMIGEAKKMSINKAELLKYIEKGWTNDGKDTRFEM